MPTEEQISELIADFHSRIEGLKRNGVPAYPPLGGRLAWAEASEERKMHNIVWESMSVRIDNGQVIEVPGMVCLETIERDVDYAKLPEKQRNALESLRYQASQAKDADKYATRSLVKIANLEYGASGLDEEEEQQPVSLNEQFKAILGGKYGQSLEEATERALDRMQGKGREL